jgi:hypothetical protein
MKIKYIRYLIEIVYCRNNRKFSEIEIRDQQLTDDYVINDCQEISFNQIYRKKDNHVHWVSDDIMSDKVMVLRWNYRDANDILTYTR